MKKFKIGLIINPIAGIGGSVALKGSDGEGIAEQAIALGAEKKANLRAQQALTILAPYKDIMTIYTVSGVMGADSANTLGFDTQVLYSPNSLETTALDTENAVNVLQQEGVDLLLFAGGDGTARNICSQVSEQFPVLGIPAGCKIHSGVYAVTPKAAGRVVELMITNQLVSVVEADVMDIDESQFRQGIVKAKRFGEMTIPCELRYVQAVKSGGKESDELVLQDIAAHVIEQMDDELFVMGSGSTVAAVMEEAGFDNTLLGVDLVLDQQLIASDVTEPELWQHLQSHNAKLVITVIGGQGHILGRGNQQLSPRVIRAIGKDNIFIVATKSKLAALNGKPLIVDTGDDELNQSLSGFIPVVTGYKDQVLYPVDSPS